MEVPMHGPNNSITAHNQEQERVSVLLIRVRDLHHAAQQAGCNALHHAFDAGDALIKLQKQVKDPWKKWLAVNCSVPVRTAMLYVQLAHHRKEIEEHLGELSIRGALRLISKAKPMTKKKSSGNSQITLQALWARLSEQELATFCDLIGVPGFRKIWSLSFHRALLDSVRIEKFEAQPDGKMTVALWTALSLLASIDDPGSSDIVRKANIHALLTALRTVDRTVRAAGNSREVALSIVDAGTIDAIRASHKKTKKAA
jgi:hypothetical protein